jgi:hypothetical protein
MSWKHNVLEQTHKKRNVIIPLKPSESNGP